MQFVVVVRMSDKSKRFTYHAFLPFLPFFLVALSPICTDSVWFSPFPVLLPDLAHTLVVVVVVVIVKIFNKVVQLSFSFIL